MQPNGLKLEQVCSCVLPVNSTSGRTAFCNLRRRSSSWSNVMKFPRRRFLHLVAAAAFLAATAPAAGQDWPTRPMTLVVPFAAGGSSDVIARIVADGIGGKLRQPVVVENVTGGGGLLGGRRVAKAAPDGYQFVIGNVGSFAQSRWLYKKPFYDPVDGFCAGGAVNR